VENVPGAGGEAGVGRANALAAAGEAVLLLATPSTHLLLPARRGADAGPSARLQPLLGLGSAPNVLLIGDGLRTRGIRSPSPVSALLARARAEPLVYGSAGAGQTIHLCTALLCELAGVSMTHRPFDGGSADAYAELAAGRVHVYFDNLLGCREAIAEGRVEPLAVSAAGRSPALPDVPTLAECGFPGHALEVWFGVFGAGLPAALLERVRAASTDADLAAQLAALGLEGTVCDARELAGRMAAAEAGWRRALACA
jgi:tripartite-type tricarboxylate transporter receptor subunit TctC